MRAFRARFRSGTIPFRRRIATLVLSASLAACQGGETERPAGREASGVVAVKDVIERHSATLLNVPGVVGLYEGRTADDKAVIRIMVAKRTPEHDQRLPKTLEGYPVEIEETGEIRPMQGR